MGDSFQGVLGMMGIGYKRFISSVSNCTVPKNQSFY